MAKSIIYIFTLWAGLIIGVSFIATPAKFMAANLTMPVAMEIGKVTFSIFNKIEWIVCIFTLIFTFFARANICWLFTLLLTGLLSIETFYLLPALSTRADFLIRGEPIEPSIIHWLYIRSDVLKVVVALVGTWQIQHRAKL